ncbi:MAG: hypothetical protein FJZ64_01895 [Chlamydiae bacterium]|nr:hypothetical protein [Chlamydiota bacterium]
MTATAAPIRLQLPGPQTLGNQSVSLKVNHSWEEMAKGPANLKRYHGVQDRALAYLRTDSGLFRFGQLMERVPRFANELLAQFNGTFSPALATLSSKGLTGWTWLTTFPRIATMTPGTIEAVKDAREAVKAGVLPRDQIRHKVEHAVRETTDLAAMLGYGASMTASLFPQALAAEKAIRTAADGVTFAHDVISLDMNARNLQAARHVDLAKATPEMKQVVAETKRQNMFAIAKDVVSIVSGILGLGLIATGVAVIPGLALAGLSLASTILAIIRDLYKDTMMYKPIEFYNNKHVTQLA